MADDFDDGKDALREAIRKEYQDLKSAISNVNTRTLLITILANASSLFSKASELGIDLKISELLESAEAKVKSYESEVTQDKNRQEIEEGTEQKRLEEALAEAQKITNEVREKEVEEHVKKYKDFQKDFNDQLKADSDLLEQAAKNPDSLTPEQRAQLTGQYSNEQKTEKEAAKKRQQEMSVRWKEHYAIKNKAKESIAYRQGEIKKNEAVINHSNTAEPVREQRRQENVVHKKEVAKQEQNLAVIKPEEQRRKTEREQILALVNGGNPELAAGLLKRHYSEHIEEYGKERQQDPNHQGYNELHSMVMALGGHEKLGLPKPEHPIAGQQMPSPENIKSALVIEHQAKSIEKPNTQTLQEHVESIKKGLERQQSSNDKVGSVKVNSAANKNQVQDEAKPPGKKSRFAQNIKKMEGRG